MAVTSIFIGANNKWKYLLLLNRADNFRFGNIEINVLSPLFINFKINLIFSLYPEKCEQFNQ